MIAFLKAAMAVLDRLQLVRKPCGTLQHLENQVMRKFKAASQAILYHMQ